ncbi:MAG: hypothetical protein LBD97_01620 [Bifidobacteriaceae bacterium]|jgi:hypothetical protein|nr:hypothetical protein [Bifidobacteriaceae bacterium]
MTDHQDNRFVAYEYTTVEVRPDQESLYRDAYRSFGWATEAVDRPAGPVGGVRLHLKRDRRIPNKHALVKLQRQFDTTAEAIGHLERSKTSTASIAAFTVGLAGSAALAGSVFCYMASSWVPFVGLGLIGLVGWALPYFMFNNIKARKTGTVNPEIERQHDTLYDICEQAAALSAAI